MSAEELQVALPTVERVAKPQRLGGGLAGQWRAAPTPFAGLPFESVFYFAAGGLQRIEYLADAQGTPDGGAAAFAELLTWGRGQFGRELGSNDPGNAYAAWVQGDTDIYVQHTLDPRRPRLRLVYKLRLLKDGSTL